MLNPLVQEEVHFAEQAAKEQEEHPNEQELSQPAVTETHVFEHELVHVEQESEQLIHIGMSPTYSSSTKRDNFSKSSVFINVLHKNM